MRTLLLQHWFLSCLAALIAGGILTGHAAPVSAVDAVDRIPSGIVVAVILFLMSFTLDTEQLLQSLRSPGPVAVAVAVNAVLAPLLGLAMAPWQAIDDFRVGLVIAACVPCTMAAASVWTRKGAGNDAVSLLVTLVTNSASIVVVPFWLAAAARWLSGPSTGPLAEVLNSGRGLIGEGLVFDLALQVLVPLAAGQAVRQIPRFRRLAVRYKTPCSNAAQVLILTTVLTAAVKAGGKLAENPHGVPLGGVALVWACSLAIHAAALGAGWCTARQLRMSPADQVAVAIAGSQKTLPVGLLVGNGVAKATGLAFAVFPMLMFHASQLIFDTLIIDRLNRAAYGAPLAGPAPRPSGAAPPPPA